MSEKKEYIERGALIEDLERFKKNYYGNELPSVVGDVIEFIDALDAADVEPVVRGEWKEDNAITRCSVCGEHKEFPHWTHCPNCGAHLMERSGSGE